jgi:hypothetical protein
MIIRFSLILKTLQIKIKSNINFNFISSAEIYDYIKETQRLERREEGLFGITIDLKCT